MAASPASTRRSRPSSSVWARARRTRSTPFACGSSRSRASAWTTSGSRSTPPSSSPIPRTTRTTSAPSCGSLADLLKKEPELPLSVFGHADPVGNDDYNKQLSGRRATVVYALLVISPTESSTAISMWQGVARQENWGARERAAMQALTGLPAGTAESELFRAYMQKLMPPELKLGKKNFLAQGVDPKGKGDFQGCSEFNPAADLLHEAEQRVREPGEQDAAQRCQRREPPGHGAAVPEGQQGRPREVAVSAGDGRRGRLPRPLLVRRRDAPHDAPAGQGPPVRGDRRTRSRAGSTSGSSPRHPARGRSSSFASGSSTGRRGRCPARRASLDACLARIRSPTVPRASRGLRRRSCRRRPPARRRTPPRATSGTTRSSRFAARGCRPP